MKKIVQMAAVAAVAAGASSMALAAPSFYVGAQAGYQDNSIKLSNSTTERDEWGTYSGGYTDDGYSASGIAGGVFAGINFSFGNGFFAGLEANAGTSGADAEFSDFGSYREHDGSYSSEGSSSTKLEAGNTYGIAALAGMEVTPRTSIYGRLGYQRAKFEYSETERYSGRAGGISWSDIETFSEKDTYSGIRFGLGVQTEVTDLVAVRLDWSQTHYSSKTYYVEMRDENVKVEPTENLFQVGVLVKF